MICFLFPSIDLEIITFVRDWPLELVKIILVLLNMSFGVGLSSTILAISNPVCAKTIDPKIEKKINFFNLYIPFN